MNLRENASASASVLGRHGFSTHLPSGENLMSRTGFLKLKWCKTVERLKLTRTARPSALVQACQLMARKQLVSKIADAPSSTLMRTVASGERAMRETFLRFSKARVRDLLL